MRYEGFGPASHLADWFYAAFALVATEFLLEVFFGLGWPS